MKSSAISKLFTFLFIASIVSCDDKMVYDEYITIANNTWDKDKELLFSFSSPDTINNYNLFINLRNNNDYKYSNLHLIVQMAFPHGKTIKDTLTYKMAKPDGSFLGTGFTDIKENKLWYKGYENQFTFEESGDYTLKIEHAMRENGVVEGLNKLDGVTDVGFRIERSIKN